MTSAERAVKFLRVADEEYRHTECCPIIRSLLADNERMRGALERMLITEGSSQAYIMKQIAREALEGGE